MLVEAHVKSEGLDSYCENLRNQFEAAYAVMQEMEEL